MIRFYNAKILTMDGGCDVTEGAVWTDGDKITLVGKEPDALPAFEREINVNGNLLMPKTRLSSKRLLPVRR